jgi:Tol biopolymer transport system component
MSVLSSTPEMPQTRTNRFDRAIGMTILFLLVAIALVIWRGDRLQLQVMAVTPAADARNVSTRTHLQIRFDQPIERPTKRDQLVFTPPLTGSLWVDDRTLTFIPTTPLRPNTAYQVTLNPGLLGQTGGALRRAESWRFQTGDVQIVYSALDDTGKEQLFLAPVQVGSANPIAPTPLQLTSLSSNLWEFVVAPDSSRVLFTALREDGTSDLWSIRPGEQQPTALIACPNAVCSSMAWSADGRTLAFSRRNATELNTAVLSPPRLWIFDSVSGESFPAFPDDQKLAFEPRWSADGQWLSYVSPDLGGVGVYNLQTKQEQFYASTTGEPGIWHPQRNELLVSVVQPLGELYVSHLWLINPVDDIQVNLSGTEKLVEDGAPAWSPDGAWLALRRKEFTGPTATPGKQIWLMRADGSEATALTADAAFDFGSPLWSPDGRYLLFHRLSLKGPEITLSVWVLEVASRRTWQVANPGQRPQWMP